MTISPKLQFAIDYLVVRAGEASTWRGIILLATVAGAKISPDQMQAIIMVGLAISGFIGVVFSDSLKAQKFTTNAIATSNQSQAPSNNENPADGSVTTK